MASIIENFDQVYRENFDYIFGYSLRLFYYNKEQAMDHTQDVFLKAWQNKHQFRGDANIKTWLGAIAKNMFYMQLRTREHHAIHVNYDEHFNNFTIDSQILNTIEIQDLLALIPEGKTKQIFMQFLIKGCDQTEIANCYNLKTSSIRGAIYRTRQKIKEKVNRV